MPSFLDDWAWERFELEDADPSYATPPRPRLTPEQREKLEAEQAEERREYAVRLAELRERWAKEDAERREVEK